MFIVAGLPCSMRINGIITRKNGENLPPADTSNIVSPIYQLAGNRDVNDFEQSGDDDFSFAIPGLSRFRVSAYKQRGALSVVIRIISFSLPNPTEIGIPQRIIDFSNFSKGLVLVTGIILYRKFIYTIFNLVLPNMLNEPLLKYVARMLPVPFKAI